MTTLYMARFETKSFTFELVAESESKAKDLMIDALTIHGNENGLNENMEYERNVILWFNEDDIVIINVEINKPYKDGLGMV